MGAISAKHYIANAKQMTRHPRKSERKQVYSLWTASVVLVFTRQIGNESPLCRREFGLLERDLHYLHKTNYYLQVFFLSSEYGKVQHATSAFNICHEVEEPTTRSHRASCRYYTRKMSAMSSKLPSVRVWYERADATEICKFCNVTKSVAICCRQRDSIFLSLQFWPNPKH